MATTTTTTTTTSGGGGGHGETTTTSGGGRTDRAGGGGGARHARHPRLQEFHEPHHSERKRSRAAASNGSLTVDDALTTTTTTEGSGGGGCVLGEVATNDGSGLYKARRMGRAQDANGEYMARRLIDFRGFDLSESQARDIARFIDLLPPEMEPLVRETLENCVDIDDAIAKLASVKMVEQTAQCSVGDFSEPAISEANSAGGNADGEERSRLRNEREATSSAPVLTVEWVNAIVSEMGASADVTDAQNRASRVLQTFEGVVRQKCAEFSDYSKVMKMKRENALLKRAVAIQNSRMQDLAPLQARVRELESTVARYDEQLQAMQRQNYSLSVNLRLAMDQSPLGGPSKNHDVF
jgi:hypothetical protein